MIKRTGIVPRGTIERVHKEKIEKIKKSQPLANGLVKNPDGTSKGVVGKTPYFKTPLVMVGEYGTKRNKKIYSNLLEALCVAIKDRVKGDNQCVLLIYGGTGSGKSTLALQIIRTLNPKFKLEDVYLYTSDNLIDKLDSNNPEKINWFDEGSVTLNNLGTVSKEGKRFAQFFDTMRYKHYISIICLPSYGEVNKRILKHVDYYIECPSNAPLPDYLPRGFFHVYKHIIYPSGKSFNKLLGTGVYRNVPKKLREEYQALKDSKATEFTQRLVRESKETASEPKKRGRPKKQVEEAEE